MDQPEASAINANPKLGSAGANFCLPSERKPFGTAIDAFGTLQVNCVEIVVSNGENPFVPQLVFDFQAGMLGVVRRILALYKSQWKLLQD